MKHWPLIKNIFFVVVPAVLIVGSIASFIYWKQITPFDPNVPDFSESPEIVETPEALQARDKVREVIAQALQQGEFQQLATVLLEEVTVQVAGEACCGKLSQAEAVAKIESLAKQEVGWELDTSRDQSSLTASIIAASDSEAVLVFSLNEQMKVAEITWAQQVEDLIE